MGAKMGGCRVSFHDLMRMLLLWVFWSLCCATPIDVESSMVSVAFERNKSLTGTGTGIFLRTLSGLDVVLTCKHVLDGLTDSSVCVSRHLRDKERHRVAKIWRSPHYDLALLELQPSEDRETWKHALLSPKRLRKGYDVYTWGFPNDQATLDGTNYSEPILSVGYVSAKTVNALFLDMHVYYGNSGGPLFRVGEPNCVVGVVCGSLVPWRLYEPKEFKRICDNVQKVGDHDDAIIGGMSTTTVFSHMLRYWERYIRLSGRPTQPLQFLRF